MSAHPYLRAYLAGVFVPTLVLPFILTGFITVRLLLGWPFPIERFIIFPMSVVPVLFGIWNMVYLASHERTHIPLGIHGAILPFLGAPIGATVAHCLGMLYFGSTGLVWFQEMRTGLRIPYPLIACAFLAAVAGYYLVWKYVIGFLNAVLTLA